MVDTAADAVALRIASGIYPVGSVLPSVRALAADLGINPSTVQVVMARLQAVGFVEARPRVGMVVRDYHLYGGIETCRYVFRFAQRLPELAIRMFTDVLATRINLVLGAVTAIARDPRRYDPAPTRQAVQQLELLIATTPDDAVAIARAELHALRLLVAATRNTIDLAVFNSAADIMLDVPDVLRAVYTDTALHAVLWSAFLDTWEAAELDADAVEQLASLVHLRDHDIVERLRVFLGAPAA